MDQRYAFRGTNTHRNQFNLEALKSAAEALGTGLVLYYDARALFVRRDIARALGAEWRAALNQVGQLLVQGNGLSARDAESLALSIAFQASHRDAGAPSAWPTSMRTARKHLRECRRPCSASASLQLRLRQCVVLEGSVSGQSRTGLWPRLARSPARALKTALTQCRRANLQKNAQRPTSNSQLKQVRQSPDEAFH